MNKEKLLKALPLIIILLIIFGPALKSQGFLIFITIIVLYVIFINKKKSFLTGVKNKSENHTFDINKLTNMKKTKNIVLTVLIAFLLLWLFTASIQVIDAGETGVYSLFGRVKDKELRSGFHLINPLAKVTPMSIRTEEYTMSIAHGEGKKVGADAISSLTKEGLSVDLDMTVLYRLDEEKASDIYKNVGLTYEEKIIRPSIRTSIRDVIAQYEAKDIYSEKRGEASNGIADSLKSSIEARGIIIEEVLLRNVNLPSGLTQAIQEKLQAEQEAQKYDFILEKEKKEKQRKVIEAEGQRDAQTIINQSLTTNYLYYLYVNQLKDRQGTIYVPTSPGTGLPMFRNIGG